MKRGRDYPHRAADLKSAPGALGLVQAFVNTADLEHGTDELSSPRALVDWLAPRGFIPATAELGPVDLERAIAAREALRAQLVANRGGKAADKTVELLDRTASESPVVVRFGVGGEARFAPGDTGLGGALGLLFAFVVVAQAEDRWTRLKACADSGCRAAFYDGSPNRSRKWCDMRRCGNRRNSRRSKRRRKITAVVMVDR